MDFVSSHKKTQIFNEERSLGNSSHRMVSSLYSLFFVFRVVLLEGKGGNNRSKK